MADPTAPADNAETISPSNTGQMSPPCRGIWVGGEGNLTVDMVGGQRTTFVAVPAGTLLPIKATLIRSTGTTATNIVALW